MDENKDTVQHALAKELAKTCRTQEDITAAIRALFADTVETVLQAEMDEHLGYEKHDVAGNNSGNSRNGFNRKTISTHHGETEIEIPRDSVKRQIKQTPNDSIKAA